MAKLNAGSKSAAKIPMMAMTTSSSTSVKPQPGLESFLDIPMGGFDQMPSTVSRRFEVFCQDAIILTDNSPAFQGWVKCSRNYPVPAGTADEFFRPCRDLWRFDIVNPAINGWAIFKSANCAGHFGLGKRRIPRWKCRFSKCRSDISICRSDFYNWINAVFICGAASATREMTSPDGKMIFPTAQIIFQAGDMAMPIAEMTFTTGEAASAFGEFAFRVAGLTPPMGGTAFPSRLMAFPAVNSVPAKAIGKYFFIRIVMDFGWGPFLDDKMMDSQGFSNPLIIIFTCAYTFLDPLSGKMDLLEFRQPMTFIAGKTRSAPGGCQRETNWKH